MNFKEAVLKQKGKWQITYKNNYKLVLDLDKMLYDTIEWYSQKELHQEITNGNIDTLLSNVKSIKKIN